MSELFSRRERWFIGAVYGIPILCLCAALFMAFTHAKDWAGRHNSGDTWEHWAFAIMIELPALFGLILMTLWPKIGGGRKPKVPRLLFFTAVALSMYVQQAYVGAGAALSARFVAGLPSFAAGAFLELVFWVMGLVEEAREDAKRAKIEAANAEVTRDLKRAGLGDIPAAPTLTSATPAPDTRPDTTRTWTPTSPPPRPDMSATAAPDIRPDARPDMTPTPEVNVRQTSTLTSPDIPQVTPTGRPDMSGSRPWDDLADIDPDAEDAERVVALPDVRSDDLTDIGLDDPDTEPDVRSAPDTDDSDTDQDMTKQMSDPRWAPAAEMRRNGATVKAIAQHFSVTERTIGRWKLPAPDSTKPVNGKTPHLTGAEH